MQAKRKSRRRPGAKICTTLGVIFLAAVILVCLPMVVPRVLGGEVCTVVSGSMEPALPVGSLVIIAPIEGYELENEDIVAYASGDSIITHRVVENHVVDGKLITKGDANETEDPAMIPYSSVIGKVKIHIPVIGEYMSILSSLVGKIYLLGVALCGVLFLVLGSRLKTRK